METNVREILTRCRYFKIRNWMDSMWMVEAPIASGRVDLMVVDLRTNLLYGYEVKMSRGDFVSDKKWNTYVPFFNYFYFATPPGIIKPDELPKDIGILELRDQELRQTKRARELQPSFVGRTLGEDHLLKTILQYMRDFNWRSSRMWQFECQSCRHFKRSPRPKRTRIRSIRIHQRR